MNQRPLGWRRPAVEHVRFCARAAAPAGDSLLAHVAPAPTSDLHHLCKVFDQGQLGSCQTQAMVQAVRAAAVLDGNESPPDISRMALFSEALEFEGNPGRDVGAAIGSAFYVGAELGLPPEGAWPYDPALFGKRPGPAIDRAAYAHRGIVGVNYHPIASTGAAFIADAERALTAGMVVPFGVWVSTAFCSQQPQGTIQAPGPADSIAGGHALCLIGHDSVSRRFLVLNSWGAGWHDPELPPGCCWFSYDYAATAADAWCVPKVVVLS